MWSIFLTHAWQVALILFGRHSWAMMRADGFFIWKTCDVDIFLLKSRCGNFMQPLFQNMINASPVLKHDNWTGLSLLTGSWWISFIICQFICQYFHYNYMKHSQHDYPTKWLSLSLVKLLLLSVTASFICEGQPCKVCITWKSKIGLAYLSRLPRIFPGIYPLNFNGIPEISMVTWQVSSECP